MTTDITVTSTTMVEIHNRVVLIGTLNMQAANRLLNTKRQNDRAELEQVLIQTVTAFGEPCAIELDVSPATPGYELLDKQHAGKQLAVEGELRRKAEMDKRYAVADQDIGARMLRYRFHVNAIRWPREDEPITTFAQIQGVVVAEPIFQRHAMLIGTEIARTIVQVSYSQPSNYPGSRAVVPTTMEIAVSVPLAHPDTTKLLRPGNRVVIEGGIDSVIVSQLRNPSAAAKVDQLDQAWTEGRDTIAPEALDKELRDYRRERGKFAETQALSIVAGYVELLAGTPREIEQAREASGRNSFQNRLRRVVEAAPAASAAVVVEQPSATAFATSAALWSVTS